MPSRLASSQIYLIDNPAVLSDTQARIALALIAAVIGVVWAVRRRFT
ncbi:MAG: hypothetical protein KKD28_04295 [Chloroflexi bacterium]|nr:hypothetical protein [Chloroflexota bacterium]